MQGLTKTYPTRKVLENINLSFYPDAKIGVLGVNGSGKSTLLRIMAGIDKEFNGEGWVAEGARVGYLEQEPQLDAAKSVRENVMEGVAPQKAISTATTSCKLLGRDRGQMTVARDRAEGSWDLIPGRPGDGRSRCPHDADVSKLSGGERRRVALCRLLLDQPDLLLLTSPQPSDAKSVNGPKAISATSGAILTSPRPHFLDNVTGWILELDRAAAFLRGQLLRWLSQKQKRLAQEGREEEARQRTSRASRNGSRPARARQAKSKARYQRYEELVKQAAEKTIRPRRSSFRWRSGSARTSSTSKASRRAMATTS
jgi:ATPase subunit of ABC transporter with duplicated ATPase domains